MATIPRLHDLTRVQFSPLGVSHRDQGSIQGAILQVPCELQPQLSHMVYKKIILVMLLIIADGILSHFIGYKRQQYWKQLQPEPTSTDFLTLTYMKAWLSLLKSAFDAIQKS